MIQVTLECVHWDAPVRLAPGAGVLIGRDDTTVDIPLKVSGVSKQHCELAVTQSRVVVRDLGSTNGTYINGKWINEATLHDGDTIEIGPKARVMVRIAHDDGPPRCEQCETELGPQEAARGGRYRDGRGMLFCLRCALAGAGEFTPFGRFRLLFPVGHGLTGRVFEAHDTRDGQRYALKILNKGNVEDAKTLRSSQRFKREIELMRSLEHPWIVGFHDAGEVLSQSFMAMQFVDGADLGQLLDEQGRPFTIDELTPVVETAASALDFAHSRGVIHRDIKPGNILLDRAANRYLVTDFGLARRTDSESLLTAAGSIVGTLEFMAPEQLENAAAIDGRADVYGLAATLFYLVSGQRPFRAPNDYQLMMQVMSAQAPRLDSVLPDAPPGVVDLIAHAMQRSPDDRLPTPRALLDAWKAATRS